MSDAESPRWELTESVDVSADAAFAFRYLASIENMAADPGIVRVEAESRYRDRVGIRGTTHLAGGETIAWVVTGAEPNRLLAFDIALADAILRFEFRFDDRHDAGTTITQRITLFGRNAAAYVSEVEAGFRPTLKAGMDNVARRITAAFDANGTTDGVV